jgi:hypothetical protein
MGVVGAAVILWATEAVMGSGLEAQSRVGEDPVSVRSVIEGTNALLVVEGSGVRFERRSDGTTTRLAVVQGDDRVDVLLEAREARVSRGGREVVIAGRGLSPERFVQVAELLQGSGALHALDQVARSSGRSSDPAALELRLASATLRSLQGDPGPALALKNDLAPKSSDRMLVRAMARESAAGMGCYDAWQDAVTDAMSEYLLCDEAMRWIPYGGLACTYEWLFKVGVANAELMSCVL